MLSFYVCQDSVSYNFLWYKSFYRPRIPAIDPKIVLIMQ